MTTGLTLIDTQPGHRHMAEVCAAHGLTRENLRSWNKSQRYVRARKELWFRLMIVERTFSFPEAGRLTRKDHTTVLHKLHALVPLSDELVGDSPFVAALVTRKAGDALQYAMNNAIINGTGVAQPLGILNAACTVSVAKETGQLAATLNTNNITKMWARLFRGMASGENSGACWFINQDVAPQLQTLTLGIGLSLIHI